MMFVMPLVLSNDKIVKIASSILFGPGIRYLFYYLIGEKKGSEFRSNILLTVNFVRIVGVNH